MKTTIAALQMVSTPDVERNLADADALLAQAAAAGAALAALPEYFCVMGRRDADKLLHAETPGDGPIQRFLADAARRHRLWIIGGTLPLRTADPVRARNSCLVFAPDGRLAARYDKLHLFRYDNGSERYDEGAVLEAGDEPTVVDAAGLRVGLSVCYDLRFPELYRALSFGGSDGSDGDGEGGGQRRCDLLSVPAAFTFGTGRAHWELLLRARAVENQCYVIAAAQGGTHENGRRTWGHSMIVGPWGEVLAERAEGAGIVTAEVDAQRLAEVRRQLPALEHRRQFRTKAAARNRRRGRPA